MQLFHATDEAGMTDIRERGFAVSGIDCPDGSWLAPSRQLAQSDGSRTGWFVVVEVPDHVADKYRVWVDNETPAGYCLPWSVLNELRGGFCYESGEVRPG